MSIPLEAVIDRPGRTPLRLTPQLESFRFSTAAVGGFSSASFALPGDPARWKRELPHLAMVRLVYDTQLIWEGQLEDITLKLLDGASAATVQCFGLQRLLAQTGVRRIWSKRDLGLKEIPGGTGAVAPFTPGAGGGQMTKKGLELSIGQYDQADLTKNGVRVAGNGVALNAGDGIMAYTYLPGLSVVSILGTTARSSANWTGRVWAWTAGSTASMDSTDYTTGTFSFSAGASRDTLAVGAYANVGFTPAVTDTYDFSDVRLLGTSVSEDASGGFYGGTILRDLVALVPGLSVGIIEDGSDYTIPSLERAVRSACLDVVSEVARLYTREWRVWEDGKFDWKAVNRDEPQWVAVLADLADGSELTTTVDGQAKTIYVQYIDAASGLEGEASASSTAQRNPFVKQGKSSDVIVPAGVPMTSSSASQLASKLIGDVGTYPPVQGRLQLPATKVIRRASGSPLPALMIRGGDNIIVADLPKTELFGQGRDGETLFHVISTECDLGAAMVTLEVEGQTNRADVILARLAASTRALTG